MEPEVDSAEKYTFDFTDLDAGTYYLNLDKVFLNDDGTNIFNDLDSSGIHIQKKYNQTIVFNTNKKNVELQKFLIENTDADGKTTLISSSAIAKSESAAQADEVAGTIVWNMPNADTVSIDGSIIGIVLATKVGSEITVDGTSGGWLVADTVDFASGEWHNIWQHGFTPVCTALAAKKVLEDGTLETGQFGFDIKDANGTVIETAQNDGDGNISFDALKFVDAGTYEFAISEEIPDDAVVKSGRTIGKDGIEYDTKTHKVEITVDDSAGNGDLSIISVVYNAEESSDVPTFTNRVTAVAATDWVPVVSKNLAGRDLSAGEFNFVVKDADGNEVSIGTNNADGTIDFAPITEEAAGTFTYEISEVRGNRGGVTYDNQPIIATVVASDNGDGALSTMATYSSGGKAIDKAEFVNTYSVNPVQLQLNAHKTLDGKAPKNQQFSFNLVDEAGNVIQTVSNDAEGNINFSEITYTKAGAHTYTMREVKGDQNTINYDTDSYEVTVAVTDNGEGQLDVSAVYGTDDLEAPTFENITLPLAQLAVTGSAPQIVTGMALLFLAFGAVCSAARRQHTVSEERFRDGGVQARGRHVNKL